MCVEAFIVFSLGNTLLVLDLLGFDDSDGGFFGVRTSVTTGMVTGMLFLTVLFSCFLPSSFSSLATFSCLNPAGQKRFV